MSDNAIVVQGHAYQEERLCEKAGLTPGAVLMISSDYVVAGPATAGAAIRVPLIAGIPEWTGENDVAEDYVYAAGESCIVLRPVPGSILRVRVAASTSITAGETPLQCDGTGALEALELGNDATDGAVRFVAAETKTTGASPELSMVYVV